MTVTEEGSYSYLFDTEISFLLLCTNAKMLKNMLTFSSRKGSWRCKVCVFSPSEESSTRVTAAPAVKWPLIRSVSDGFLCVDATQV